jgi:antitoxin CcdA
MCMTQIQARRKPTNVSLDAQAVADARALGVNVSQACEMGLVKEIKAAREARWLAENRDAIEATNQWVEENGLPLAKYRVF